MHSPSYYTALKACKHLAITNYKWQFAPRFSRNAFGWKSDTPTLRIKEALAEIKVVAKSEPVLAAEGAVLFLEKLAPAIEQVDSSSGGIGSAVNRAIETLVPIISKADVARAVREKWLDRLFEALQEDDMPYLEYLGDFWGELCSTPEIAAKWADYLADVDDNVGPLRTHWRIRLFQRDDSVPKRAICRWPSRRAAFVSSEVGVSTQVLALQDVGREGLGGPR